MPDSQWLALPDAQLTAAAAHRILDPVDDDLWVAAAAADRRVNDPDVQRALLALALARTQPAVARARDAAELARDDDGDDGDDGDGDNNNDDNNNNNTNTKAYRAHLTAYFAAAPRDAQLCRLRAVLLDRLDRLNTYVDLCQPAPDARPHGTQSDAWDDDPWDAHDAPDPTPPVSLPHLLLCDLLSLTCSLASEGAFHAVHTLMRRHPLVLHPFRFHILDCIPDNIAPSDFARLLPALDTSTQVETAPDVNPWRDMADWSERPDVVAALRTADVNSLGLVATTPVTPVPERPLASAAELTTWYTCRATSIVDGWGLVDFALATVHQGMSLDIPDLDGLAEDLTLLSRLVYDAPMLEGSSQQHDWTLDEWRALSPLDAVQAYLRHSTAETVVRDIRRLVLPFIFISEARAERAGTLEPSSSLQPLSDYVLRSRLPVVAAVFEASKPTLALSQRIIKSDESMARLALACIYGSDSIHEWNIMSEIFECLPVWPSQASSGLDLKLTDELADLYEDLRALVTPSTSRLKPAPADLFSYFASLPLASLSHALDILDVHLESGEILSRWNVPAPARWFLQSAQDAVEQRAWANRMARRTGACASNLQSSDEWEGLLEDMLRLTGGETGLKGAFGLLDRSDVIKIYFGGLLSTGHFQIAKTLLNSPEISSLGKDVIEGVCIASSHEFYDNASAGNYTYGDMKLAYDCLQVPPRSEKIIREQEFIEATSRICSFNVMSRPGIPISPIEIRLTKDLLSLVSRVLSSTDDAYKHTGVILDLVQKLGFKNDPLARVKTLAMLADTALQAEDFGRAYDTSQDLIESVLRLRESSPLGMDDPLVQQAVEVCWVACYQLGRQPEFTDIRSKLKLLGQTLQLCPPERLVEVLSTWRRLEQEDMAARRARLGHTERRGAKAAVRQRAGVTRALQEGAQVTASSLADRLRSMQAHIPTSPDAAILASRTFNRVTANLPFHLGVSKGSGSTDFDDGEGRSARAHEGPDVSSQASKVLQKGIGWLIGADEDEE